MENLKPKESEWEKEFDVNYPNVIRAPHDSEWTYGAPSPHSLKAFLRKQIEETKSKGSSWEEQFDDTIEKNHYKWCIGHSEGQYCHLDDEKDNDENIIPTIKTFIRKQIEEAYTRGKEEGNERYMAQQEYFENMKEKWVAQARREGAKALASELIKKLEAHKELFEPAYEEADKAYVQALDRAINLIREEEK